MSRHPDDGQKGGRTRTGISSADPSVTMGLTPSADFSDPSFSDDGEPAEQTEAPKPAGPDQPTGGNFSDMSLSELVMEEDPSNSQMSTIPNIPSAEPPLEEEPPQAADEESAVGGEPSPELEPSAPDATEIPEDDPGQDSIPGEWQEVTPISLDELGEPPRVEEGPPPDEPSSEEKPEGEPPSDPALEGWKSWPGQRGSKVQIGEEVTEEEAAEREAAVARQAAEEAEAEKAVAKKEAARFEPPPEESMPGLLLPNVGSPRPIGNIVPAGHSGDRLPGGGVMLDWRGYPSRIIDRFLETEGRGVIYLVLGLLLAGLAVTGWLHRDAMQVATGIDLEERRVEIVVVTRPVDAALFLEGELVRRSGGKPGILLLAPSATDRFIRVVSPGYKSKRVRFFADKDQELEIKLGKN